MYHCIYKGTQFTFFCLVVSLTIQKLMFTVPLFSVILHHCEHGSYYLFLLIPIMHVCLMELV